jgi:hypothetical protein
VGNGRLLRRRPLHRPFGEDLTDDGFVVREPAAAVRLGEDAAVTGQQLQFDGQQGEEQLAAEAHRQRGQVVLNAWPGVAVPLLLEAVAQIVDPARQGEPGQVLSRWREQLRSHESFAVGSAQLADLPYQKLGVC